MLAFYFDDPSSNPADNYHFSVNILFEKNENKQKEAWVGPFFQYGSQGVVFKDNMS